MARCCRIILGVFLMILAVLSHEVNAQVTFSRDWNAGKRSPGDACAASVKSTTTVCQMLMNELRQMAACEVRAMLRYQAEDVGSPQDLFLDPHGRR